MSRAFTPGLQVSFAARIERLRELPIPGEVLVSSGQKVSADQVVARTQLPGDMHILRLPERMGLEVFEVMQGLQISAGQRVEAGQILCQHSGLFGLLKTSFQAPETGTIELIAERTGHIGLRLAPTPIELRSYISGTVESVEPGKSVLISCQAAFVQGIFGIGGERLGVIHALEVNRDATVEAKDIPEESGGKILIGGAAPSIQALRLAADRGAVGFVCGAVDDRVLAEYLGYDLGIALTGDEEIPMTLIVTEGFGKLPIADKTLELLRKHSGQQASINGATQVRAGAMRPEIIIALSDMSRDLSIDKELVLELGVPIRIIRYPYFGMRAVVSELPSQAEQIATGAYTRILVAKLEDGREVRVPRANVELI